MAGDKPTTVCTGASLQVRDTDESGVDTTTQSSTLVSPLTAANVRRACSHRNAAVSQMEFGPCVLSPYFPWNNEADGSRVAP